MKLTIDLSEIDLAEYFDNCDGTLKINEVLKQEIVTETAHQIRINNAIESYVKAQIGSELTDAIIKYKDQAVIKALIEDVVSKRISQSNLFFLGEETKRKTEKMIEETMERFVKDCAENTLIKAKETIEEASKKVLENTVLSQYIDYKRLTEDVTRYLIDNVSMTEENKNA